MKHKYVRLCGIAAILLAPPAFAQSRIVLESPLDWQVIQRNAQDWAEIKVAGTAPAGATLVEIKAEPGAGMLGKARDCTALAQGAQVKDGRFSGGFKLLAGGWYALKMRFRKSAAEPAVLGEAAIEHVGVGDIFVVAGQSNASNHGAEQLIKESRKAIGWDAPWFVALVSFHGGDGVPELRDAQKSLWTDGIALEGPDSDALKGDLRDGVHFSGKGLREHGKCWAEKVAPWLEKQTGKPFIRY